MVQEVLLGQLSAALLTHLIEPHGVPPAVLATGWPWDRWPLLPWFETATEHHGAVHHLGITLLDHASEDGCSLVSVALLLFDLLESLGQLNDLLGLPVNALLSEPLFFFGLLHLGLGSASLGTQLEEVGAGALGLCRTARSGSKGKSSGTYERRWWRP